MTLKFGQTITPDETLKMLENHQQECYKNLENHAWTGKCNCFQDAEGVHILNACIVGRRLSEANMAAKKLLQGYKNDA